MDDKIMIDAFINKIKDLRVQNNLSYQEFADRVGVNSKQTIGNWMKGNSFPDVRQIITICKAFKIKDIRELFGFNSSEYITIKKQDYDNAIKDARYKEAHQIAVEKNNSNKNAITDEETGGHGIGKKAGKKNPEDHALH